MRGKAQQGRMEAGESHLEFSRLAVSVGNVPNVWRMNGR
jgi:hypothetical protein